MENIGQVNNLYHDDKVIDACSIFGVMDTSGRRFPGEGIIRAIANMHVRSNGMGGGFAVIKDVSKTMVYDLTRYRNSLGEAELIPSTIIDKPPSAELRPEQKDIDTLPAYELLDPVLTAYVEEDKSIEQIVAMGIDEDVVKQAARLVDTSEYKRRQAPPGIKITPRAFGRDRRLPITNQFKE